MSFHRQMDIRLVYLTEGHTYGTEELRRCIIDQFPKSGNDSQWLWLNESFFRRLAAAMNRGVKVVDEDKGRFTFDFVGLYDYADDESTGIHGETKANGLTFFFMPKFCDIGNGKDVAPEKRDAVILAIDRYIKELKLPEVQGEKPDEHGESILELAVRVLRDYLENGVYTVQRRELEHNGQGEIDWETTIDQYQPVFLKKDGKPRPVYMDYATELAWSDEDHYITRLHQCLVTTWGRKLEELGLSSVLLVNVPSLSEEELEHFGPPEHQLDRIQKELGIQFVTKSRNTLVLMKELIEQMSNSENEHVKQISFGTNKAEHLWEAACAAVLGSELGEKISDCGLDWPQDIKFRDYMPRPIWKPIGQKSSEFTDKDAYDLESKKSGWRLDFIRTYPPKRTRNGSVTKLVILDAKYYDVSWVPPDGKNRKIQGQPGIGDIAKQIFYQKAFEDLLLTEPGVGFVNAFLFPMDDGISTEIACGETVHLGWRSPSGEAVSFSDVELFTVYIPGIELLKKYASNEIADDWFEKIATRTLLPRWCEGEASPA